MTIYGDSDTIAQMLEPSTGAGFSEGLTARIDAMREVVSRLIDDETGRSFGTPGTSETRTMRAGYTEGGLLFLDTPARTITAITTNVTDEAGIISGGTALDDSQWTIGLTDSEGSITALRVASGYWFTDWYSYANYSPMTITGTWADTDDDDTVPAEIDWACNYITAKSIAEEQASPAGFVGSDGSVIPIRNPWGDPKVKRILRKYQLATHGIVL